HQSGFCMICVMQNHIIQAFANTGNAIKPATLFCTVYMLSWCILATAVMLVTTTAMSSRNHLLSINSSLQKLEPAQLRKIQSMDGGLGLPISRNGVNSQPQPRLSNWTSSSYVPSKVPGGPTVIEEPFKKVKKPSPQSQAQSRSTTPTPSSNGVGRTEGDKKQSGEGRGMAASTSFKSLSDSSSADTTDSKVP
ncbi:hypothetical protein GOODEAATRI_019219, partial [Goodea atripinnis]